jgi:hypothetical protein
MFRHRHEADLPVVETALDIVHSYVTRLLDSGLISNVQIHNAHDDSQEYGSDVFSDVQVEILEYIGVCNLSSSDFVRPANSSQALNGELLGGVRDVLRTSLRSGVPISASLGEKIVETWALMAGTLILAKIYVSNPVISFLALANFKRISPTSSRTRAHSTNLTWTMRPTMSGIILPTSWASWPQSQETIFSLMYDIAFPHGRDKNR